MKLQHSSTKPHKQSTLIKTLQVRLRWDKVVLHSTTVGTSRPANALSQTWSIAVTICNNSHLNLCNHSWKLRIKGQPYFCWLIRCINFWLSLSHHITSHHIEETNTRAWLLSLYKRVISNKIKTCILAWLAFAYEIGKFDGFIMLKSGMACFRCPDFTPETFECQSLIMSLSCLFIKPFTCNSHYKQLASPQRCYFTIFSSEQLVPKHYFIRVQIAAFSYVMLCLPEIGSS